MQEEQKKETNEQNKMLTDEITDIIEKDVMIIELVEKLMQILLKIGILK